eukprot:Protomagalhaensia_wolfi_Nauph_80__5739@NODE_696_length_2102_cov_1080_915657_g520_i0_p5_GENE_NODE_696_length_2102_cov_1080_915657_g520_i0NODE_696_length_2102_cov_1080_915657_g520_i0_p5_ORF_typecomplete_len104_score15_23PSI/PF01437_25/0_00034_NODE_696_length_2102_cov_1080_915657_g520_i0680991
MKFISSLFVLTLATAANEEGVAAVAEERGLQSCNSVRCSGYTTCQTCITSDCCGWYPSQGRCCGEADTCTGQEAYTCKGNPSFKLNWVLGAASLALLANIVRP